MLHSNRRQARPTRWHSRQQVLVLVLVLAPRQELARQAARAQRELAVRPPAQARPRGRMTRARGSIPGKPHQEISTNASSDHHLSRKNEPIDQQASDGQSSSQQIDLRPSCSVTPRACRSLFEAGVGKSGTHLRLRPRGTSRHPRWRREPSMINRLQSRARRRCSQRTQGQPHGS
jgi:hypothetical protein